MSEKWRVGVLGLTHDHVWSNLEELVALDDSALVAVADPEPQLCQRARQQFGCEVHGDHAALLERDDIEAVYVFSDNASGVELAEAAATSGRPMLIEKPLANNLAGAERMLACAEQHGVSLLVNWPFAWWPQMQHAIQMAGDGRIGRVWQVKYRAAHAGPQELGCSSFFCDWLFDAERNGGGAMADYCCYGSLLARMLLGMPAEVTATSGRLCKENIAVEDNALIAMIYPRALATAEGSWTQIGKLSSYLTGIYGTEGTLLVEPRLGGRLLLASDQHPEGIEVDVPELPAERATGSAHFRDVVQHGAPVLSFCEARLCRDVMEILEAGRISADQRQHVSLPLSAGV